MANVLFYDKHGTEAYVGSIVALHDTPEESDILYQIISDDEMTEIHEVEDITGKGDVEVKFAPKADKASEMVPCWKLVVIYKNI